MADQVLYMGVRGVTDLMMAPGLVNLDFADIRTVMAEMGKAMMGTGEAEGENRAIRAAEAAISNPLLEDTIMAGARGLLINITGGDDLTLFEVDQAANRIREEVDEEANIIFGSAIDETLYGPHPRLGGRHRHRYAGRRLGASAPGRGEWRHDAGAAADPGARFGRGGRHGAACCAARDACSGDARTGNKSDAAAPAGGANARTAGRDRRGQHRAGYAAAGAADHRGAAAANTAAHRPGLRATVEHRIVRRSAADRRASHAAADRGTAAARACSPRSPALSAGVRPRLRRWKSGAAAA